MVNYTDKNERYALVRKIAEEGIVLLKNECVLPLGSEKVAVFGRTQLDLIKCGTGSAFCTCEHCDEILDGMEAEGISCDEILAGKYRRWTAENPIRTFDVWGSAEDDVKDCGAKEIYMFPATQYAEENFRVVCTNIVMMGFFVAKNPELTKENALEAIKEVMNPKVVDLNLKAFMFGYEKGLNG